MHYSDEDDYDMDAPLQKRSCTQKSSSAAVTSDVLCGMRASVNIPWPMLFPKPTADDELEMKQYLIINRYESGRGCELPLERRQIIEQEAFHHGFLLTGAMSLRRQFIRQLTRGNDSFFNSRNMGDPQQAKQHASNFENVTEKYLRKHLELHYQHEFGTDCVAPLMTETEMKSQNLPMTPDFVFRYDNVQINGVPVKWIDCKTYYGASSLVNMDYLPIGKLKKQCVKYTKAFGPGAVVFLNGFSMDLGDNLGMDEGSQVLFLDAHPLDTESVFGIESHMDMIHIDELNCPQHLAGKLIGKGGATIKRMQETSGCTIVLHAEYQKVVISAPSAEQLRNGSEMVQNLLSMRPLQTQQYLCPLNKAGLVIGKQGATVRELMRVTGCVIKTNRHDITPDGRHQIVFITANTAESAATAIDMIKKIVENK